jgi:hypothetical protein
MSVPYDPADDPVIRTLIAEADADPDVLGLVLTGSRATGFITPTSDYDLAFVVSDEAAARYKATDSYPLRGHSVTPPISTKDIWSQGLTEFCAEARSRDTLPDWSIALVLFDRNGSLTTFMDMLRRIPSEEQPRLTAAYYDAYLNSLYRSLKCWRRGNVLGARLEAAESVNWMLHTLFALEGRWRPFGSRLSIFLPMLAVQGWDSDDLAAQLLDLLASGEPGQQRAVAQRIIALLRTNGYHHVYESWEGEIDDALTWQIPGFSQV